MLTVALIAATLEPKPGCKLYDRYVNLVLRGAAYAGIPAVPVILPFVSDPAVVAEMAGRFDAYVFTGGDDVDPAYYGQARHEACGPGEPVRDRFELALLRELIARDRPVFGICRGIQVMNVALGGTLWQDLPAQLLGASRPHVEQRPEGPRHMVYVSGSLAALLGQCEIVTNSYHHQAIRTPGKGVRITARSRDGVAEAMEQTELRCFRAVQWHPEVDPDEVSMKLMGAFLADALGLKN